MLTKIDGRRRGAAAASRALHRAGTGAAFALGLSASVATIPVIANVEVPQEPILIGGVMDLEGRSRGLGKGMRAGIEAALRGQTVNGRAVEFVARNDSYTPSKTVRATQELLDSGVFLMMGNVGTPTAKVSLPILADHGVPALGFFTGAGLLRPGVGDVINFRASYVQETQAVIDQALKMGVEPTEICAYVQNDAYGMAGVVGIQKALRAQPGAEETVSKLEELLAMEGENPPRNFAGPIGVYQRNTSVSRDGYRSLKSWESISQTECKVVVTVGTYAAISKFVAYSRYKGEDWIVSAVSFTGADSFKGALSDANSGDKVLMTQVVPLSDSALPIVAEAKLALDESFGPVSLEGYIVGRLFLAAAASVDGPLTRESFLAALRGKRFDIGGLTMDFTNDNQGSDLVVTTYLTRDSWQPVDARIWRGWLNRM